MAASLIVDHRRFGSGSAPRAPSPVPELARLFRRPNSSVLAKMANLDGSRSHGAATDLTVGLTLSADLPSLAQLYRMALVTARAEGIAPAVLPDFLALEAGGEVLLIGQEELTDSDIEIAMADLLRKADRHHGGTTTERELLATVRVGQHRFARSVLDNCGRQCVFCGLALDDGRAPRLLVASHIKPWRDSTPSERLDFRNGLAACPTHDVAFDTGLLTVNGGRRIHIAAALARAAARDGPARAFFGRPPLGERLQLPLGSTPPGRSYLDWHRERIFQGA
jgi:putative restriction endonuclease